MPPSHDPAAHEPPPPYRCRRLLRLFLPILLLCLALASAAPAHAGGCDGCPAPSLTDLQKDPGFKLTNRPTWWGGVKPDHYYLSKGACNATIDGPPDIEVLDSWLALRATGEVWHCPHSKSVDTITVESSASDSTEWSFAVKLSSELGSVGASFKREVEMGNTTGTTVTEVTRISKTITPTFCHRITWKAYFQVAKVKAKGTFTFKQHWAWWTKNTTTGSSKVHASGDIYMDCGSGELELTRKAPISGHFDLSQRGCDGPECAHVVSKHVGLFPPWPGPDAPDEPDAPDGDDDDDDGDDEPRGADAPATSSDDPPPSPDEPDSPSPGEPDSAPSDEAPVDAEPSDDGPQSSADLGDAPTGPATDPLEPSP